MPGLRAVLRVCRRGSMSDTRPFTAAVRSAHPRVALLFRVQRATPRHWASFPSSAAVGDAIESGAAMSHRLLTLPRQPRRAHARAERGLIPNDVLKLALPVHQCGTCAVPPVPSDDAAPSPQYTVPALVAARLSCCACSSSAALCGAQARPSQGPSNHLGFRDTRSSSHPKRPVRLKAAPPARCRGLATLRRRGVARRSLSPTRAAAQESEEGKVSDGSFWNLLEGSGTLYS